MKGYTIHTDLACEAEATHDGGKSGTEYAEQNIRGFRVARLAVQNETGEHTTGKRRGRYITVFSELMCDIDGEQFDALTELVADEIGDLAENLLGRKQPRDHRRQHRSAHRGPSDRHAPHRAA